MSIKQKIRPKIRLDRLLANLGYGSRKDAAFLMRKDMITSITDGAIRIHKDPSEIIDTTKTALFFDGEPFDPLPPFTILLHKPVGYSCSNDEIGQTVFDLLPDRFRARTPALSIAGRLDKDSTGSVLLTDDGDLLHRIISPKHHVTKKYIVTLMDPVSGSETETFMSGTLCLKDDAKPLKPALWQPTGDKSGVMYLSEGRYHQIRRMFGAVGNRVLTLHRAQIGGLPLGDLCENAYKQLSPSDIDIIFSKEPDIT